MKTFLIRLILSLSLLICPSAHALITGGSGNDPVENRGWPAGSEDVANLKTRIAMWEGPPFGGGQSTFEYRGASTADFNRALESFAKIESSKRELVVQSGPQRSFWLGIEAREDKSVDPRMDWSFVVWNEDTWNKLFNDPDSTFLSDSPNYRKPVDPPRMILYVGGGNVNWEEVVVPDGVTLIDRRAKDGSGPSVIGKVRDIVSGKPLEGVSVTLQPGTQQVEGELPVVRTGDKGEYEIREFPPGAYTVVASKEGYATKRSLDYSEIKGSDIRKEDFKLSKAVGISGVVRGPDGQALAGARVTATNVIGSDGFGYTSVGERETRTNTEGGFNLEGLPVGECRLLVWIDGYYDPGTVKARYRLPGKKDLVIEMIGTGTIRGTLKRRGKGQLNVRIHPPGGEKVGSWGGSMNCKPDGSFEFENVPEGDYLVGPGGSVEDMVPGAPGVKLVAVKAGQVEILDLED